MFYRLIPCVNTELRNFDNIGEHRTNLIFENFDDIGALNLNRQKLFAIRKTNHNDKQELRRTSLKMNFELFDTELRRSNINDELRRSNIDDALRRSKTSMKVDHYPELSNMEVTEVTEIADVAIWTSMHITSWNFDDW